MQVQKKTLRSGSGGECETATKFMLHKGEDEETI